MNPAISSNVKPDCPDCDDRKSTVDTMRLQLGDFLRNEPRLNQRQRARLEYIASTVVVNGSIYQARTLEGAVEKCQADETRPLR